MDMTKSGLWQIWTWATKNAHCANRARIAYGGFSQIRSHMLEGVVGFWFKIAVTWSCHYFIASTVLYFRVYFKKGGELKDMESPLVNNVCEMATTLVRLGNLWTLWACSTADATNKSSPFLYAVELRFYAFVHIVTFFKRFFFTSFCRASSLCTSKNWYSSHSLSWLTCICSKPLPL